MATLQENEARLLEIKEKLLTNEDISLEDIEALNKEIDFLGEERTQLIAEEAAKAEPKAKVVEITRSMLMPIKRAASASKDTARIALPALVLLTM